VKNTFISVSTRELGKPGGVLNPFIEVRKAFDF
jgi:hypothetical protein